MVNVFVSYTSRPHDWAFWVGYELLALGYTPHIHEWEIPSPEVILRLGWDERHESADHILCIVSSTYPAEPFLPWERRAAQSAGYAVPIFVEPCKAPTPFTRLKRCDLYGLNEGDARARLKAFLEPATKRRREVFLGGAKAFTGMASAPPSFPGKAALSNVPIAVPLHFMGRDESLAAIETAFQRRYGRAPPLTVLHGMRGVGKTTLAATYVDHHCSDYRVIWRIRAQTAPTLALILSASASDWAGSVRTRREGPGIEEVMRRLRLDGEKLLLIFDSAIDADGLRDYMPHGGQAKALVTSNGRA